MTREEAVDWVGTAGEWFVLNGHEYEASQLSLAHAVLVKWLRSGRTQRPELKLTAADVAKFREFATIDGWDGMVLVPAFLLQWALLHLEEGLARQQQTPDIKVARGTK